MDFNKKKSNDNNNNNIDVDENYHRYLSSSSSSSSSSSTTSDENSIIKIIDDNSSNVDNDNGNLLIDQNDDILSDDNSSSSTSTSTSSTFSDKMSSILLYDNNQNDIILNKCDDDVDVNDLATIDNNRNCKNYGSDFFEGAEKRLAIYFKDYDDEDFDVNGGDSTNYRPSSSMKNELDLRKLTRSQWKNVLDIVKCNILNVTCNDYYDAYLLSESSLFVNKKSFILKTCGTTTLLLCLDLILDYIFDIGFTTIENVFYSHKNFLLPSLQKMPHNSLFDEFRFLNKHFNGYLQYFGHANSDHWYLYQTDYQPLVKQLDCNSNNLIMMPESIMNQNEFYKFEIIMEKLHPNQMKYFYFDEIKTAKQATKKSGIDTLIPGMIIDDHLFQPCGYSMNGLLDNHYCTIHISPEKEFSYVSLETNIPQPNGYRKFIKKIIDMFKPGKFMMNLFLPNYSNENIENDENIITNDINQNVRKQNNDNNNLMKIHDNNNNKNKSINGNDNNNTTKQDQYFYGQDLCMMHDENNNILFELLSMNSIGKYRRCELQLTQNDDNNIDIIFARFVDNGVS